MVRMILRGERKKKACRVLDYARKQPLLNLPAVHPTLEHKGKIAAGK
jgi:hypothetical protein